MDETTILSAPIVIDTCLKSCKAMKLMSKQLVVFSSVYSKSPSSCNDKKMVKMFMDIIKHIGSIQEILTELGEFTKISLGEKTDINFPDNIIISREEYEILYKIFLEFSDVISV